MSKDLDATEKKTLEPGNQGYADTNVPSPEPEDSGIYSHEDFKELSLSELETLTGLEQDGRSEADYREAAWETYKTDVTLQAQWGTARQGEDLPEGV